MMCAPSDINTLNLMVLVVEQPVLSVDGFGGIVMVKTQPGWSHGHISTLI